MFDFGCTRLLALLGWLLGGLVAWLELWLVLWLAVLWLGGTQATVHSKSMMS